MKNLVLLIASFFVLMAFMTSEKKEEMIAEVIYPKIKIWTTPSKGEESKFNSSGLEWLSIKRAKQFKELKFKVLF